MGKGQDPGCNLIPRLQWSALHRLHQHQPRMAPHLIEGTKHKVCYSQDYTGTHCSGTGGGLRTLVL